MKFGFVLHPLNAGQLRAFSLAMNAGGSFRPDGSMSFVPLKRMVPQEGKSWCGAGTAFSTSGRQLAGTLLGWWGPGHKEPWLILSDLPPQQGDASWYGLRGWIETHHPRHPSKERWCAPTVLPYDQCQSAA